MKGLRWLIGRRMTHTTWLLAARVSDLAAEGLRLCAICFVGARVSDVAPLQRDCGVPGTVRGYWGGGVSTPGSPFRADWESARADFPRIVLPNFGLWQPE